MRYWWKSPNWINALGVVALWGLAACGSQTPPPETPSTPLPDSGIIDVTQDSPDLRFPHSTTEGATLVYQLGLPIQLGPNRGAYLCNLRVAGAKGTDFENGSDLIPFDDITGLKPDGAVPITRNHNEPNPNSKPPNQDAIMVKYPVMGGFVPFGAKRADGSPHPHAGTGFGLNQSIAWRTTIEGPPPYGVNMFGRNPKTSVFEDMSQMYSYLELHQLAYDGETFSVANTERVSQESLLPGWRLTASLMTAIPEGDDLLFAMKGYGDGETGGSGLARWRRTEGAWRPISYVPVTGEDGTSEASAVRDQDGSILFCARGSGSPEVFEASETRTAPHDIRIWRSRDNGETWAKIIHVRGLISAAPIVLNSAADGTPYVAANLYEVFLEGLDRIKLVKDSRGSPLWGGRTRNTLCLWPLNQDRTGLLPPLVARDLRKEFGPPPGGTTWRVDHPVAVTLRLADGRWRNVIALRILEYGELTHMQDPTSQTGAYLEEVISAGEPIPIWNF